MAAFVRFPFLQEFSERARISFEFFFFPGISTLIKRLDALNYSTIFYIFDESVSRDFDGDCDMAKRLSAAYHKRIIFWPCPQMKVSRFFSQIANMSAHLKPNWIFFVTARFMRFHFTICSMCPIIMSIIPLLTLILIQNVFIYDQHLLLHFQENL